MLSSPCTAPPLQVIDAFAVPRVLYDPVRKLFHRTPAPPRLQADAEVRACCRRRAPAGLQHARPTPNAFACRPPALLPTSPYTVLHVCAASQSKVELYVSRFHLVHQRLKRNKLFRPAQVRHRAGSRRAMSPACLPFPLPGGRSTARHGRPAVQFGGLGGGGASECELTELKAMLGVVGERRYVVGFLTQVRCAGRV